MKRRNRNLCKAALGWTLAFFLFHSLLSHGQTAASAAAENKPRISIALFDVDATPPTGSLLAYDPMEKSGDLGLRAKGMVIMGSGLPVVLCAVDWIGIGNESQDAFKQVLARAASTLPERVAIHTVHQHDAPVSDWGAEKILVKAGLDPMAFESSFDKVLLDRLGKAVQNALNQVQPVTHLGTGRAAVEMVASNRRIAGPDGKIIHSRTSATRDPDIRRYPEGLIDPEVSLISFWNEDKPVAVLSYYAVHPQSYYLTKEANPDFPGIARYLRQLAVPDALHIHFNGAGGNITAGKYNDGAKENRLILAQRLAEGMRKAWEATEKTPLEADDVYWHMENVRLPANEHVLEIEDEMHQKDHRWLTNNMQKLAWYKRQALGKSIPVSCLALGKARILHLPGELFVEYQLAAKSERPDLFVAMAAYGDYGPFYIGTEKAYQEGGYEIGASPVTPEAENMLTQTIKKLLHAETTNPSPQHALLTVQNNDDHPTFVRTLAQWEEKRKAWQHGMEKIMGPLPSPGERDKPDIQWLDTLYAKYYNRYNIRFLSDDRNEVTAFLYVPHGSRANPGMLVLHSTGEPGKKIVDGQSHLENRAVARELAERGYVVLAPDYPSFGDQSAHDFDRDGFESGTMLGIWNHIRCVDLLSDMEEVDPERIGVIGHSLGGHNALFVAAFDHRLKAVISSCGWTPFDYYDIGEEAGKRYGGRLGPWAQERYMPKIKEFMPDKKLPFDFPEIIALVAPRPFFSNSPVNDSNFDVEGVKAGIGLVEPVYRFLGFPDNIQARYPEAGHDFPSETRKAAYGFLDKHFGFSPIKLLDDE
ncbi:alpha/beta hydrolase family protein [Negadavirga shengliensis]|uniref:Alpha/beta hydrolase family protein n=1 Tax=Negadavirga shengliensis TaxID=1389218 RepID=A0ABV9SXM5_9BACT